MQSTKYPYNKSILLEIWAGLLLILIVLIVYQNTTENSFHFDDHLNITDHGPIKITELSTTALWNAATNGMLPRRVIPNFTFAIDWWRGNGSPRQFLQTNIALHILATLAVWRFFITILSAAHFKKRNTIIITATISALVWSTHPIQVQAVSYIVQRMSSLALLFSILTLLSYINWRRRQGASHIWLPAAIIFFVCAVGSKENAWVIPVLAILFEASISSLVIKQGHNHYRPIFISAMLLLALYFALDLIFSGPIYSYFSPLYIHREYTIIERLLTQPRVIAFHLAQWFTPFPGSFSLHHDFIISKSLLVPITTLYAMTLAILWILSGILLLFKPRYSIYAFLILWVPITLVIESTIVPLEIIYEHRMYMPSVGLAVLSIVPIAILAENNGLFKTIYIPLTLILCLALAISTRSRVHDWKSEKSLMQSSLRHAPGSARLWSNLGSAYASDGDTKNALLSFDKAISLDSDNASAHSNRGKLYFDQLNEYEKALADFNAALNLNQNKVKTLIERGNLFYTTGFFEKAWRDYSRAISIQKDHALAYYNRGLLSIRRGDMQTAARDLEQAASIEPDNSAIHGNLGVAYLGSKNILMSLNSLEHALFLDPKNALARYNYARALSKAGRLNEALDAFKTSCQLGVTRACGAIKQAN